MKYKVIIITAFLLASLASWAADQKEKKGDDKMSGGQPFPIEGIVYALPRTVLNVQVTMVREEYCPGPYAAFAEKYLGYQGVKQTAGEKWKIKAVEVSVSGEADPEALYKTNGTSSAFVSLLPDGTLAGINLSEPIIASNISGAGMVVYSQLPSVLFPDLSSDDQYDVQVNPETGSERITFKTTEVKAREAADYLFRLRQKRAYSILSPSDALPEDGKGFEVFVQQAEKLEKEYVSLFLGKTFFSEHVFTISYTPGNESVKNDVLFRFSEEKGFLPKTDISGKPVTIDLIKDNKLYTSAEEISKPAVAPVGKNGLFYRIPVNASLSIIDGFSALYTGKVPVAQFGFVAPVPDLLINENTTILFDPATGAIKNWSKIK